MSKERYEWYMGTSEIIDNKTKKFITQDCPELLNKQSKQISDLETKLAEKDAEIKLDNAFWKQECDSLQKTLAEKTLTIEQINKAFIENRSLWKGKYERATQDKISFAVEKLEQVRKLVDELLDNCGDKQYKVWEVFDNQIEGLKKEMK